MSHKINNMRSAMLQYRRRVMIAVASAKAKITIEHARQLLHSYTFTEIENGKHINGEFVPMSFSDAMHLKKQSLYL